MQAALIKNNRVVNVVMYDPEQEYQPVDNCELVILEDQPAGIGYLYNGTQFTPFSELTSPKSLIKADGTDFAEVTYREYEATGDIIFNVNGVEVTVPLVNGSATIEVTADVPDTVTIQVKNEILTIQAVAT